MRSPLFYVIKQFCRKLKNMELIDDYKFVKIVYYVVMEVFA